MKMQIPIFYNRKSVPATQLLGHLQRKSVILKIIMMQDMVYTVSFKRVILLLNFNVYPLLCWMRRSYSRQIYSNRHHHAYEPPNSARPVKRIFSSITSKCSYSKRM